MIVHTLIFSFGEGRTQAEQDKFLATVADISLESGLCIRVETRRHLPLPNDALCSGVRRVGGRAVVLP